MQFVDVKNDVAFHKIFGDERKTVILISFLNAIMQLKGMDRVESITISNPYQAPILPNFKASILDVRAKDFSGKTFIVEMQVADITGMDKRLLYYTSKEYSQQILSGDKYTELNPVVFIGIFDFLFTQGEEYLSHHAICNVITNERVIKDMDFYFIELPKFLKQAKELENVTDKWIYFIKEAENLDLIPNNIEDEGLNTAYLFANKNTWTKDELNIYDYAAMREQDGRGRLDAAIRKASKESEKIGEEKGEKKNALATAKRMQLEGERTEKIMRYTGLTKEEIENL
jgi:predicted transposase/invertase (TIGR01784 family)